MSPSAVSSSRSGLLRHLGLCLALGAYLPAPGVARAQGPGFEVGRLLAESDRTLFRLGFTHSIAGPLGSNLHGTLMQADPPIGNFWGAGADLTLFRGGQSGLYLVGGISGGIAPGYDQLGWYSWSAGLGYELFPFSPISLSAEGRWRVLHPSGHDGLELSLRLGFHRGSGSVPASRPRSTANPMPPSETETRRAAEAGGASVSAAELLSGVIRTATDAMGTPYRWGGTDTDGFDCSGLIRYAYQQHGITLPRRSVDQAREGTAVTKSVDALVPGDILTFSNQRGRVTHVGLYVGEGKFIHSASRGVQLSVLSPDDVYGKWWYQRWVGARRIVH